MDMPFLGWASRGFYSRTHGCLIVLKLRAKRDSLPVGLRSQCRSFRNSSVCKFPDPS